mgnify:FL=1
MTKQITPVESVGKKVKSIICESDWLIILFEDQTFSYVQIDCEENVDCSLKFDLLFDVLSLNHFGIKRLIDAEFMAEEEYLRIKDEHLKKEKENQFQKDWNTYQKLKYRFEILDKEKLVK